MQVFENDSKDPLYISSSLKPGQTYTIKPIKQALYFKDSYSFTLDKSNLEDLYIGENNEVWKNLFGKDYTKEINLYSLTTVLFNVSYLEIEEFKSINLVDQKYLGHGTKIEFKPKKDSTVLNPAEFTVEVRHKLDLKVYFQAFYDRKKNEILKSTPEEFIELFHKEVSKQPGLKKDINLETFKFNLDTLKDEKITSGTTMKVSINNSNYFDNKIFDFIF